MKEVRVKEAKVKGVSMEEMGINENNRPIYTAHTTIANDASNDKTKPIIRPINGSIMVALASVILVSVAQLMMKWGMMQFTLQLPELLQFWQHINLPQSNLSMQPTFLFILDMMLLPLMAILSGLIFYSLSMVLWVYTLKHLALSVAYPLLSLSYVLVYLGAVFLPWMNEAFSNIKLIGIICILIGLFFMTPKRVIKNNNKN